MFLIGLLLPFKRERSSRRHRSKSTSSHRRSERSREHSHREHLHRGHSRRRHSHQQERDESKMDQLEADQLAALAHFPEDTLARLYMNLEQSFIEDQIRGLQGQGGLDHLPRETPQFEEPAPQYSIRDNTVRQPTIDPFQFQTGVADSPDCRDNNGDSVVDSACCCCCCCCCCCRSHCNSAGAKCSAAASELDDGRGRVIMSEPLAAVYVDAESGVEVPKQVVWANPLSS